MVCDAGSTKNRLQARQYIQPETAAVLAEHIATKSPKAPLFSLPHSTAIADMIQADLEEARPAWLSAAKGDPQQYSQREQSDFLAITNHEGKTLVFHSLRHTCGA